MGLEQIVNRQVNPRLSTLPDWFGTYRANQTDAIHQILAAFEDSDVVVLDAPVGAGKTLIAETVRRMMDVDRTVYVCHTKSLQEQFLRDYPYAHVMMGRNNYIPLFPMGDDVTCEDCTGRNTCPLCEDKEKCPYTIAKSIAGGSELAVLNTAYWLREANGPGESTFTDLDLVIIDECDTLERVMMSTVEVVIGERFLQNCGMVVPERMTVPDAWVKWCGPALSKLKLRHESLAMTAGGMTSHSIKVRRTRKRIKGLINQIEILGDDLREDPNSWVYTGDRVKVGFKPTSVSRYGELVWRHGKKFLLMSGSVISPKSLINECGYTGPDWRGIGMDSTFPVDNRLVVVKPVANITRASGDVERQKMCREVSELIDKYPNDRILVHTVSYDLAKMITAYLQFGPYESMGRAILTYINSAGREAALAEYKQSARGVLVAPSMDRGIDLPGDLCRVQIIVKVPFPNLGDKQVSARMHSQGGQQWYAIQTVRTIMQMCGRGVRSDTDHAITYILDSQFRSNIWTKSQGLFPRWWRDGVRFEL